VQNRFAADAILITPRDQAEAMMPARFLVRRLQRGAS